MLLPVGIIQASTLGVMVSITSSSAFGASGRILRPALQGPVASVEALGGSWDLVSKVISPLIGVISNYKYSYLSYNPSY